MSGPNHGTSWAYQHHKCRCEICVTAYREQSRASKARIKAREATNPRTEHAVAWDYSPDSGGVVACRTCHWAVATDSATAAKAKAQAHAKRGLT